MTREPYSNFIKIDGDTLYGNVATLSFDIDFTGEGLKSDNEKSPLFRLFSVSRRGRKIDVGGIWQRENAEGNAFYALTLNTGHGPWYANLGRYPGQDDDSLMAVIENQYLNAGRENRR